MSVTNETAVPELNVTENSPPKRKGGGVSIMAMTKKKKKVEPTVPKQPLRVDGYAFHDNIIGIVHRKNDDEDAFNGTLRNKILQEELHEKHIHAFVTLRDRASGKDDLPLIGEDNFNKIMFLNINTETFSNVNEAHQHVIDKVNTIHNVSQVCQNILVVIYLI